MGKKGLNHVIKARGVELSDCLWPPPNKHVEVQASIGVAAIVVAAIIVFLSMFFFGLSTYISNVGYVVLLLLFDPVKCIVDLLQGTHTLTTD